MPSVSAGERLKQVLQLRVIDVYGKRLLGQEDTFTHASPCGHSQFHITQVWVDEKSVTLKSRVDLCFLFLSPPSPLKVITGKERKVK
jgi:hypothetical protein